MLFEKINDKQIRCTIDSSDLSSRGIKLVELAYGSEKARNLFKDMINQASIELGFEAHNTPLMVEATPLPNESLLLTITKVDNPDELDTRFSRFSPAPIDEIQTMLSDLENSKNAESNEDLSKLLTDELINKIDIFNDSLKISEQNNLYRVFSFTNLDTLIEVSRFIGTDYLGFSSLYKNPSKNKYYLLLNNKNLDSRIFYQTCNVLMEYGNKEMSFDPNIAHLNEHFELFIENNAINKLAAI